MEEKKEIENNKEKKLSYSELENVAHQLSEQNRQLYNQLQKSNLTNMFKRLDYLFKVIENGKVFKQEFLEKCITEIEELMTVPEEENKNTNTEE